jgi:wyosine [tRNA(Phe)-imidazoG37] synthetase (radical SAM superfamily)
MSKPYLSVHKLLRKLGHPVQGLYKPHKAGGSEQIILYTEVTSYCNNRCIFCAIDKVRRKGFIKDEVREKVREFILSQPDIKFLVYFHLVGEPLLYNALDDYIRSLLLPNTELWVCTNGVLLTDDRVRKLRQAGLKNVWFSMFYTNDSDYKRYVRSDNFDSANRNLVNLLSKNEMFDRIRIVTFSENADAIKEAIKNKNNVILQTSREKEEWNGESKRNFICISIDGEVCFDWKDYNLDSSIGNICQLDNDTIIREYNKLIRTSSK